MQQRFGIAQAIIADPPLLILDELTSGLDPIAQKEVKDIVINLKENGKTIFFSSHQMTEVEMICDQIGILHKGKCLNQPNWMILYGKEQKPGKNRGKNRFY
jgi:ABC-2 type transport system ATP-binding protein